MNRRRKPMLISKKGCVLVMRKKAKVYQLKFNLDSQPQLHMKQSQPYLPVVNHLQEGEDRFIDFFRDIVITHIERVPSLMKRVNQEFYLYPIIDDVPICTCFKFVEDEFSHIANAVRNMYCIPTTSTPSDRAFGKAGILITAKRTMLKPEKVDMILFEQKFYFSIIGDNLSVTCMLKSS